MGVFIGLHPISTSSKQMAQPHRVAPFAIFSVEEELATY